MCTLKLSVQNTYRHVPGHDGPASRKSAMAHGSAHRSSDPVLASCSVLYPRAVHLIWPYKWIADTTSTSEQRWQQKLSNISFTASILLMPVAVNQSSPRHTHHSELYNWAIPLAAVQLQ